LANGSQPGNPNSGDPRNNAVAHPKRSNVVLLFPCESGRTVATRVVPPHMPSKSDRPVQLKFRRGNNIVWGSRCMDTCQQSQESTQDLRLPNVRLFLTKSRPPRGSDNRRRRTRSDHKRQGPHGVLSAIKRRRPRKLRTLPSCRAGLVAATVFRTINLHFSADGCKGNCSLVSRRSPLVQCGFPFEQSCPKALPTRAEWGDPDRVS